MSRTPRALIAVDAGSATSAVSLVGRLAGRWRLLGSISAPAGAPVESLVGVLLQRIGDADPSLLASLELAADAAAVADLPRLEARSAAPRTLGVLAASRRAAAILENAAARTGWRAKVAWPEIHDPREMTEIALDRGVDALLVGCGDPPGPDERDALNDLAALVAAAAARRPDLPIVFAGPVRARRAWTDAFPPDAQGDPARLVDAPALGRGGRDDAVRTTLEGLSPGPDARGAMAEGLRTLADLLERRVELIEVGFEGGMRAVASPGIGDTPPTVVAIRSAEGALVDPDLDDRAVDSVLAWTTGSLDRHRMGDRLRELRMRPWADTAGDGARLRLAAARAAMARIVRVTPDLSALPTPDLTIAAGGAFAVAPPRAVALAVADTVRRPGATQVAFDHARLLAPIGTIDDEADRRALLADLADDLLLPLGSLVLAAGVAGRAGHVLVGSIALSGDRTTIVRDLTAGELEFLDLAPGETADATLEFRETARIGRRARKVRVSVSGGLAGVAVDLRDVPLHLPERRDRRRAMLATWNALAWPVEDR